MGKAAAVSKFLAVHDCDRRVLDRAAAYCLVESNPICSRRNVCSRPRLAQ